MNNQFVVAEISCFRVMIDIKFFDTWQPKMLVLYYKCFPYVSCFNEFGPETITLLLVYYIREVFPDIYSRAFSLSFRSEDLFSIFIALKFSNNIS